MNDVVHGAYVKFDCNRGAGLRPASDIHGPKDVAGFVKIARMTIMGRHWKSFHHVVV